MEKFENKEALLAWIVDFFSTSFGNSAILKGGMALRLMHSPRYTNDVDYIFIHLPIRSLHGTNVSCCATCTTFISSKACSRSSQEWIFC